MGGHTVKCPKCGYQPTQGAPRKFDYAKAAKLRKNGMTFREIADHLGVTEGAVRAALKQLR